jgi:hypothetical protein
MTLIFTKLPEGQQTAERTHAYSHIECNVCGRRAPSPSEMPGNFGIQGEGWKVRGGLHLCPEHVSHEGIEPSGPEYRDQ